jgi:integrase
MYPHGWDKTWDTSTAMARRKRASRLENRTSRLKLAVRRKPHDFTVIAPGIAVGYRRNKSAGAWVVRTADGHGGYWTKAFAIADDHEEADGDHVLTYWQASEKARAIARGSNSGGDRPATVAEALDNYAAELRSRGGDLLNVTRVRRHLPPTLAAKTVGLLGARDIRQWRDGLLKAGLAGASADRTARSLKAALALAAREDQRITNTAAWRLPRLPDAERARNAIMSDADVRKLVTAAYDISVPFGLWVEAHAVTGARTSQLMRLQLADLQDGDAAPRLMMPSSHKGRRRRVDRKPVPITVALAKALREAAHGRAADSPLLPPLPAGPRHAYRCFKRAVAAADLAQTVTPIALRHSSITRMLLAGVPVRVVASAHDTSIPMIEKNYAAYIGEHSDTVIRRTLIDTGAPPAGNKVVSLAKA